MQVWSSLQAYGASGVRYVRQNRRRVALISVGGFVTAAAALYVRQQYRSLTRVFDEERSRGAQALRSVYTGSRRTIEETLRRLLAPGRQRISSCSGADPDSLLVAARKASDSAEKRELFEKAKIATFVRLIASIYYAVTLYGVLLVQVNLIARYSSSDADAPVEALPGGVLTLETKQAFLALARCRLFEEGGVQNLVAIVSEAAEEIVGPVSLRRETGPDDLRALLRTVCHVVERRTGLGLEAEYSTRQRLSGMGLDSHTLDPHYLMSKSQDDWQTACGSDDANLRHLMIEAQDLCDELDYCGFVRAAVDVMLDATGGMVDGFVWGVSPGKKVPFASVIAKLAHVSRDVLGTGAMSTADASQAEGETACNGDDSADDSGYMSALLHAAAGDRLGAAVFLSGEKSTTGSHSRGRGRGVDLEGDS